MILHPGRKCACNCGQPAEGASKYFSEKHQQAASRKRARENHVVKVNCAFPGCIKSHWANREFCIEHSPNHRKNETLHSGYSTCEGKKYIMVIDPMVADPYYISSAMYDLYAADYKKMGIEVVKKGQPFLL